MKQDSFNVAALTISEQHFYQTLDLFIDLRGTLIYVLMNVTLPDFSFFKMLFTFESTASLFIIE